MDLSKMVFQKLELLGYKVQVTNRIGDTFRCLIKFPGIFYRYNLSRHSQERMIIWLNTEPQNIGYKSKGVLINNFGILLKIKAVPVDVLLAQKLLAILKRIRPMGRDFYDAIFLFSKTKPNYNYLKEKMGIEDGKYIQEIKYLLLQKSNELNLKKLAEEISPFLFSPDDAQRILLFPELIQQEFK